jgi:hypothetical protein
MGLEIHDSAVFGQLSTTFTPTSSSSNHNYVGAIIGRDNSSTATDKTSITFTSIIVLAEFLGITIPALNAPSSVHAFNRSPNNITYSGIVFLEQGNLKDFGNHSSSGQIQPSTSIILQDIQTFKDFNWSIELKSDDTNDSIWLIDPDTNTNKGYPYLRAFRHLFED